MNEQFHTDLFFLTTLDEEIDERRGREPRVPAPAPMQSGVYRVINGELCHIVEGLPPWFSKQT